MLSWKITEIEVLELLKKKRMPNRHFLHLTNVNLILNYCHAFLFLSHVGVEEFLWSYSKRKEKKKESLISIQVKHKIELPWFLLNYKNGLGGQILL